MYTAVHREYMCCMSICEHIDIQVEMNHSMNEDEPQNSGLCVVLWIRSVCCSDSKL